MSIAKATRIALAYAFAGALWILFSDQAADALFSHSPSTLNWVQTTKGWFFIFVTAVLLWVTLRRQAGKDRQHLADLAESEARFRAIFDSVGDGIFVHDAVSGTIVDVNRRACEMFGYSREEMAGMDVENLSAGVAPFTRVEAAALLARTRSEGPLNVEWLSRNSQGTLFWTELSTRTARIGSTYRTLVAVRDISARKSTEAALRRHEGRIRAIFDTSPSAIFLVDRHGRILLANQRMAVMFRMPLEKLTGHPYVALVHPGQRQGGAKKMKALLAGEIDTVSVERRYLRGDGTEFWGHLAGSRLSDVGTGEEGLVGIISDISGRKSAEDALAAAHALTNAILDSMLSAVIGLDENGVVTHFNRCAQLLSGRSFAQALGRPVADILPQLALEPGRLAEAVAGRTTTHFPKLPLRSGSDARLLDMTLYPLDSAGAKGSVMVLDDVTERTRLEEVMIQTEKMMSVGGLAAGMAHEINNPLGGIIQGLQVVLSRMESDSPANEAAAAGSGCELAALRAYLQRRGVTELLREVRSSAIRAANIVGSMLEFSRKGDSTPSPSDINALLDKTLALCATDYDLMKQYDFRKIEIVREYAEGLPPAPCTATQIEQVFMNLLRNAAQAMATRTEGAPAPRIVLRTRLEAGHVVVEIEDNGPGMSEEVRRRIFEPFFSTKPPGEGTGLGLSVSYFIVANNHKGSLEVDSSPGAGARFSVRLPLSLAGR